MLNYREHDLHTSHADGFGARVFEVYLMSEVAGEVRNMWRFAKRHQAEWIIKDMAEGRGQ